MRHLSLLLAASSALALAPLPAAAQDQSAGGADAGDIAAKLNDPLTQYAVAGMLSAMSKALLEMRVDPLVDAIEQASGRRIGKLPDNARVADLAGTDHDRVREQIVTRVPRAMAAMGALAAAAKAMTPEIERAARRMRDAVPEF
jgi:hypothetical protein